MDIELTSKPRAETVRKKVRRLKSPARHEDRETGRIIRREVREPGARDFAPVEIAETERVFIEAVFEEVLEEKQVTVIETVPLSKRQLAAMPVGHPVVTERHEFATPDAAAAFYKARQRQGLA